MSTFVRTLLAAHPVCGQRCEECLATVWSVTARRPPSGGKTSRKTLVAFKFKVCLIKRSSWRMFSAGGKQVSSVDIGRDLLALTWPTNSPIMAGTGRRRFAQGQALRQAGIMNSRAGVALAAAVLLLLLASPQRVLTGQVPAGGGEEQPSAASGCQAARTFAGQVQPRPGETCLVCNKPIGSEDMVYLIDGQRVPVHRVDCADSLRANPVRFLARMKPRGALLDASSVSSGVSISWLCAGLYVLAGLVFGALAAQRALRVGRGPLIWLVLGLVGNVAAYAVLLALPKRQVRALAGVPPGLGKIASTYSPQACPKCAAENHPSARECSACGAKLNPTMESEAARVGLRNA